MEAERQLNETRFYSPQTQDLNLKHKHDVKSLTDSITNT